MPMPVPARAVRTLATIAALASMSLALPVGSAWAGGPSGSTPGSHVSGPEQSAVVGEPVPTAAQQRSMATKDAAVRAAVGVGSTARSRARSTVDDPPVEDPVVLPAHRSIKKIKQQAQVRTYWCGPATLATLVRANGAKISQTTAAKRLKTTRNGTNWYNGGGVYPMEKALERYSKGFDYTATTLPYTPSEQDVQTFTDRLMTDVAVHRQGLAGDAYEVRRGPHLNGHPNRTIYHWIAVRGYDDEGATTRYADPVAGSSISWSGSVDRYNEIDTDKIVTIFGARGYVW